MLITNTPQEAQAIIAKFGLKPKIVTATSKTGIKPVYDVTLRTDDIAVPKSIITNNIVTHNSTEPNYLESILHSQGIKASIKDVFGVRNAKTSQWMVKPRVRLYSESIAERFFDSTAKLLRVLPDKIRVGDDWFYVYEHSKDNISMLKDVKYDKAYYQKTGKMRIPAENSLPQALLVVDSYPAMLPESQDVDDPKSAMAMQARMFSEQIKRVKGKMKSKRVTVVGMNQLREKPMVMYGCFVANSMVMLADGTYESIFNIVNGRLAVTVLSYNNKTRNFEHKKVVDWFNNGEAVDGEYVSIKVSDGVSEDELVCTQGHRLLDYHTKEYKSAGEFVVGDTLMSVAYANTEYELKITSITKYEFCDGQDRSKYDLQIEDNHTYIVNQCVVHNSPIYESGGNALRFYSDVRVQVTARSNIHGKGLLEVEPSYNGDGDDKYRYIHARAAKNKLSTPFLETMMRVWVEDAKGKAHGFDLVWDCWQYLLTTGQIEGKRNNFKILIPQMENCKPLKWNDFKTLIIGDKEEMIQVFKRIGCDQPVMLRKFCKKQLVEGDGLERFFENFKKHTTTESSENRYTD